jgi:hypothetical protein
MKFSIGPIGCALLSLLMPGSAVAQEVGQVVSTGGGLGNVLVTRDGETYPILEGDPVFANDIISTRRGGSASIRANGCRVGLSGLNQVIINDGFCSPGAVAEATNPAATVSQATPTVAGVGISGSTILLGVGGVAVLGALAVGGGDDSPASP